MGILSALNVSTSVFTPYLNTGTQFDLATGKFVPGKSNMILNGGLSRVNGIVGRPQRYKSTEALSLAVRAAARYEGSELLIHDSEFSIAGKSRIVDMCDTTIDPDVIALWDNSTHDTSSLFTFIKRLVEHKVKNKKDYIVETPFIDNKTLKPRTMFVPTIFVIDSISKLNSLKEEELYDKHQLGDSKLNTVYMNDGNMKTQMMRQIPALAAKGGIYFIITAHIGNKFDLDPYSKSPKDLQYMKANDSIKNAGSQFTFLTSTLLEARGIKVLQDSDKNCQYPESFSVANELNLVDTIVCRCKNNASGPIVHPIISQYQGILSGLSNFHYLKKNKMFGLGGNNVTQTCDLLPNIPLTRKSVRAKLSENYELDRAIELLGQLCYIQNEWSTFGLSDSLNIKPKEFVNGVLKGGNVISDILNSRGYWTYNKKEKRQYMSILDVVDLINGS
jgi:hypothetical protein